MKFIIMKNIYVEWLIFINNKRKLLLEKNTNAIKVHKNAKMK